MRVARSPRSLLSARSALIGERREPGGQSNKSTVLSRCRSRDEIDPRRAPGRELTARLSANHARGLSVAEPISGRIAARRRKPFELKRRSSEVPASGCDAP